jgi:hypothetical protein
MKSRICFISVVCLILSGVTIARGFDLLQFNSPMIMLDDPNNLSDPNEPVDPNDPIDIPE